MCLLATQMLKQPYPNLTVRFFKDSPEWLYELVAETVKMGIGNPMVVNDEVYVPNLVELGYPLVDARDYYNMGCVENMIMGRTPIWLGVNQTGFFRIDQPDSQRRETGRFEGVYLYGPP